MIVSISQMKCHSIVLETWKSGDFFKVLIVYAFLSLYPVGNLKF
jgi:hypothetical protein